MLTEKTFYGNSSEVMCVTLTLDNNHILSGSDFAIVLHSTHTSKIVNKVDIAHNYCVRGIKQIVLGGGFVSCSNGSHNNLKVWNPSLELVQTLVEHNTHVCCIAVSPSGSHFVSCDASGKAIIWSVRGVGGGRECKC